MSPCNPLQLQRRLLLVPVRPEQPPAVRHRGGAWEPGLGLYSQSIDLNSAVLVIARHVSGIADPFNGHIDAFRISHVQRSDGWIDTTWNNMSDSGGFAVAATEEQEGGKPPPLAGAGVGVGLMG
jgi:hypothetical protein